MTLLTEATAAISSRTPEGPKPAGGGRRQRRRLTPILIGVALVGSLIRAGGSDVINTRGASQISRFLAGAANPSLDGDFLDIIADATVTTLSLAVVGTALTLIIGFALAPLLSELLWLPRGAATLGPRAARLLSLGRSIVAAPRTLHEVVWALLLLNIFGLDPIVGVLAIGVPFGLVTAKVLAETIDDSSRGEFMSLRAAGASRPAAFAYATSPQIGLDVVSFSFYRLECALRSAAVLGVVGAGGLGYQLALSFQTLNYEEMWTAIYALCLLSGLADFWSGRARKSLHGTSRGDAAWRRFSVIGIIVATPLLWIASGLSLGSLMSGKTTNRLSAQWGRSWPPKFGDWQGYGSDIIDTSAMSILAIVLSGIAALVVGVLVGGDRLPTRHWAVTWIASLTRLALRGIMLVLRAVPAPVWALLALFVLKPGIWPAAAALGLYNLGVLGRLTTETFDNLDPGPFRQLIATGASPTAGHAYASVPAAGPRLIGLTTYRWEVIVRDSVAVGYIGTTGLGRTLHQQLSIFDEHRVTTTIIVLFALTLIIDSVGESLRRTYR